MGGAGTSIVNNRGLTALGEAITSKNIETVELLLNKGADVSRISKGYDHNFVISKLQISTLDTVYSIWLQEWGIWKS